MDILDNLFWECQNFLDNVQKEKLIVKSCFWSGPKKGWHSKNWIGFQKHELGIQKKFLALSVLLFGSGPLPNNKFGISTKKRGQSLVIASQSLHESFFDPFKRLYFFNGSQKSCSFLYHDHEIWNMPSNFFPSGFFIGTFQIINFMEKIWDPRKSRSAIQIEFSRSKNSISWFWTSRKS